jgi:glycosyltransferase involved in cell wall biosynthesis
MLRNLDRCRRGAPPLNDRFAGFAPQIGDFLRGRQYDLALIEHFWCAPYWEQVAPHSQRTVLDLHNIESVLLARQAELRGFAAAAVLRRFEDAARRLENQWLPRFSGVLAPSIRDAELVAAVIGRERVHVYPNALPLVAEAKVREEHVIAFSGNLEYDPNVDAVRYFRSRIWPQLRSRWPKLVWRLIGKNQKAVVRFLSGDSRIQLTGPVENAVGALAAAQVAIVPLRAGSGTRVKILEAWAASRPVVSTTLGAEGLQATDGEHLILADGPEEFAAAVTRLLESEELRKRLGRAGRRLYERDFTWEAAWSRLAEAGI